MSTWLWSEKQKFQQEPTNSWHLDRAGASTCSADHGPTVPFPWALLQIHLSLTFPFQNKAREAFFLQVDLDRSSAAEFAMRASSPERPQGRVGQKFPFGSCLKRCGRLWLSSSHQNSSKNKLLNLLNLWFLSQPSALAPGFKQ